VADPRLAGASRGVTSSSSDDSHAAFLSVKAAQPPTHKVDGALA